MRCVIGVSIVLGLAGSAAADVAFNNFGPGDTYSGNGWLVYGPTSSVEWTHAFDSLLHTLASQAGRIYLPTNEHLRAASLVETCNDRFIKRCQALYPLHRYERLAPLMHELRAIKDPVEIGIMRKACDITGAGFRRLNSGIASSNTCSARARSPFARERVRICSH